MENNNSQLALDIDKMIAGLEGITKFVEGAAKAGLSKLPKDVLLSQAEQLNNVEKVIKDSEKQMQDHIKEIKRTLKI